MTDDADHLDWFPTETDEERERGDDPALDVVAAVASEVAPDVVQDGGQDVGQDGVPDVVHVGVRDGVSDGALDVLLDGGPDAVPDGALDDLPIAIGPAPLTDLPSDRSDPPEGPSTWSGPSHASAWTVVAALVVGLASGFGGGYLAGARLWTLDPAHRGPAPTVSPLSPPSAPASAAREYTEGALNESPGDAAPDRRDVGRDTGRDTGRDIGRDVSQDAGPLQPQSDPSTSIGRLLVRSTPADAQVFVDGHDRGRTPATIRDLAPGSHHLRVVREGYVIEERPIVITAERPAQSVMVDLERSRVAAASVARNPAPQPVSDDGTPLVGALNVESRPPDAQVFLDGALVGKTPFASARIGAGQHTIRIERNGYRRWLSSVWIVHGERNRITASLER